MATEHNGGSNEMADQTWTIPARALRLVEAAAKDDATRPMLNSLAFWPDGRVSAVNGFLLAETNVPELFGLNEEPELLAAKDLRTVKSLAGKDGAAELSGARGARKVRVENAVVEVETRFGELPGMEALYPKGEVSARFAISPKLLKQIVALAGDAVAVRFWVRGQNDVVEFAFMDEEHKVKGVAMPMYVEWDR